MNKINLLKRYPKSRRDLTQRHAAQSPQNIAIARYYDERYFDGSRDTGYGGYHNDGRWKPVAEDLVKHFNLWPGERALDIGCAKGFLVHELIKPAVRIEAFGLDISRYAVTNCPPGVVGRLHVWDCSDELPFPDNSFQMVTAINVLHDLERQQCINAIREIQRVSGGRAYIQVDSYRTKEERETFLNWVLTARTHLWPDEWKQLFAEAGYTGNYFWTITS